MRPIKFRAWDVVDKKWWSPGSEYQRDKGAKDLFTIDTDYVIRFNRGDIILMQFTGLTDKNGKEIWEGDILKFWGNGIPFTFGQINYEAPVFVWRIFSGGKEAYPLDRALSLREIKVIGNVYENPELIKP